MDLFTDSNGKDLTTHTMNTGPGWVVNGKFDTWSINSNMAGETGTPFTGIGEAWSNAGAADATLSVKITVADASKDVYGVSGRLTDENNMYTAMIALSVGGLQLSSIAGGVLTLLDNDTIAGGTPIAGDVMTVTLTCSGTSLSCTLNGPGYSASCSATDSTHTATNWGMRVAGLLAGTFDDFQVS